MAGKQLTVSLLVAAAGLAARAQQPVTLNVPGTPEHAPTTLTGCLMPGGGTTSLPGSGGSSGTGPAGMNADAANTGVFFVINLGKKRRPPSDTSYALVGVDAAELKKYANSKVEVRGTLQPAAQAGPEKNVTITRTQKKAARPSEVRVMSIKQIPGSCGGQ